ncbi:MAG: HlyD family efflux transporter periplasmic adaptor subunit [Muribaculaceae bacterium]|nr:HlyD family efflux transporter periplasmic adaptor subunit [Muribaculaceae bacterium]
MKKTIFCAVITTLLLASCSSTPDYDATGIFEATTVTLSAETAGRILAINAEEGDSVSRGECVAVIDTTMLVLQQQQVSSQQQSAEGTSPDIATQLAALRSQIAQQETEVNRLQRLKADGAAPQQQLDNAEAALRTLHAQLRAQLSSLSKNRNSIADNAAALDYHRQQIETQIAKSSIISPVSGTVLTRYAEPGEYATPGKPLLKIADLSKIYLRAYFTAEQLADLEIGRKVTVTADFGADKQFDYPGTVVWISEESEFTPKSIQTRDSRANLVYAVKIAVNNTDRRLKLGQYGEVRCN